MGLNEMLTPTTIAVSHRLLLSAQTASLRAVKLLAQAVSTTNEGPLNLNTLDNVPAKFCFIIISVCESNERAEGNSSKQLPMNVPVSVPIRLFGSIP